MSKYENERLNQKAVALRYDGTEVAPVIVATGLGYMAERIVQLALEQNVPVYEDTSLATMLSRLELGQEIPPELYQLVVDIYVYFLNFSFDKKPEAKKKAEPAPEQPEQPAEPEGKAEEPHS